MNFYIKDKEFKLIPRTRKVVELTEKMKVKNLNELIFNGLNDGNIKVLTELIMAFAEYKEEKKAVFTSINNVYDYIDNLKEENNTSLDDLYKEVAKVVNDMGFFKKKMTEEELEQEMKNPQLNLDLQTLVNQSAQKMVDKVAEEEFQGYLG